MKKVIGMALAALLIICCGSRQSAVGTNTKSDSSKLAPAKAVKHLEAGKSAKYYLDHARWGNTDGYLNLARCYRDGIGVERNFYRSLALITTLQNFDGKFDSDAFYRELPDDDLMRMYYECVNQIGRQEQKPYIGEVAERLIEKGNPDGFALKGVMALEGGRIEESDSLFALAMSEQSFLGVMLYPLIHQEEDEVEYNPELMELVASNMPFIYCQLGDYYSGRETGETIDFNKAVELYRKAEEQACLHRKGAEWLLLQILEKKVKPADNTEVERLMSLNRQQINDSIIMLP